MSKPPHAPLAWAEGRDNPPGAWMYLGRRHWHSRPRPRCCAGTGTGCGGTSAATAACSSRGCTGHGTGLCKQLQNLQLSPAGELLLNTGQQLGPSCPAAPARGKCKIHTSSPPLSHCSARAGQRRDDRQSPGHGEWKFLVLEPMISSCHPLSHSPLQIS